MMRKNASSTLESLLDSIDGDVLTSNVSDDHIAEELREAGGDPDAIGLRGASLVRELMAQRNLSQRTARAALRPQKAPISPRRQLLVSEIEAGRADPRFEAMLKAHRFESDTATDDELWEMLRILRDLKAPPQGSE